MQKVVKEEGVAAAGERSPPEEGAISASEESTICQNIK